MKGVATNFECFFLYYNSIEMQKDKQTNNKQTKTTTATNKPNN